MGQQNLTGRKQLGQFYTPISEAESLANWAIRTPKDRILEPSVGDGALLLPALAIARSLGQSSEVTALACDVDSTVISELKEKVGSGVELQCCDFFDLDPNTCRPVDVVLANPPFTRNHQIDPKVRSILKKRYPLKGAAGLWAYFVLHARKFLLPGGRMVIVVPGAASFADYSADLLRQLQSEFQSISLLELGTKPAWIGAANERGALLLAEGYQCGPGLRLGRGIWQSADHPTSRHESRTLITPWFDKLKALSRPLSSLADISIGLVTGCNRVFLMSASEVASLKLTKANLTPVLGRARHAQGIRVSKVNLANLAGTGEKTWLLTPGSLGPRNSPVRRRLAMIDARTRSQVCWLNKRTPWWKVDTGSACHAVFTYMNDLGPRLSLVDHGIYCTNTLHRVIFKDGVGDGDRCAAVLSIISTFGQLWAEAAGRTYGGGILKFELREARAFPILPASSLVTEAQLTKVDLAIRNGKLELARMFADEALLKSALGGSWKAAVREMEFILKAARSARRQGEAKLFPLEQS